MPEEGWVKVRKLFTLMGRFRARFYVCSASAARWGLGSGFDHVSSACRQMASDVEIPSWTGEWFWNELGQFTSPTNRQHHGERCPPDWSATGGSVAI
eukprot:4427490-Heterocapsa_arctica.AAC.1